MRYRDHSDGPWIEIANARPGWITVTMTFDAAGDRTPMHAHRHDHEMECRAGAALIEIDGVQTVVKLGDRYLVEPGLRHGAKALQSGTVLVCEHEIRRENGERDPDAFSADGIPLEWIERLTESWGPAHVAG